MRLRELIDLVSESIENRDRTFYHVTLTENVASIMERGIQPTIGDRSKKLGESSCVFLFPSRADAEQALQGWLGDQFKDDDGIHFALLEVTLPPEIDVFKTEGVDWEYFTKTTIPPECIRVLERDF